MKEVMIRLGYRKEDTVRAIIHSGQLVARRLSSRVGGRPRYRIAEEDFEAFLERSKTGAPPTAVKAEPPSPRVGGKRRLYRQLCQN